MADQVTAPDPAATLSTDVQRPDNDDASPKSKQEQDPLEAKNDEIVSILKESVASSDRMNRDMLSEWRRNVELRIGKPAAQYTSGITDDGDDLQSEVNPDWSLTKTKTANLFSQVPSVQGTHENLQYKEAVSPFMKQLNYEIGEKRANVGVAMEEVLNDVVNAAGIGAIFCGYAARSEDVDMPTVSVFQPPSQPGEPPKPTIDLKQVSEEQLQQLIDAKLIPSKKVPRVVSDKFFGDRISPVDLRVPSEFTGSCFDNGDWIGHKGRMPWPVALLEFKLNAQDKDKVIAGYESPANEELRTNPESGGLLEAKGVKYTEVFYWRYRFDSEEKDFKCIWRLVMVDGLTKPAIHEPWSGQKKVGRKYIGSMKFPIRVLTVTYITDNPIPPSDSSAGRPQVNDMRKSRAQMFQNRERSLPIRWFDTNRVGPEVQQQLMRGTFQGFIPTNGPGDKSIGEVARASYPSEDLAFDQQTKQDLMELWQIGPEQLGTGSATKKTNGQVQSQQQNFATRIGQERGRVASFFLGVCEVIAGFMVLHSEFPILTPEEKATMQKAWNQKQITHDLVLKIRPDSAIVLDTQARIQRLSQALNLTAKSGYVNPAPIIEEILTLSDIDITQVMVKPQGKPPDQPNISYRFSSKDDLINPVVFAILDKAGLAPSIEQIQQASQKLQAALAAPPAPAPPAAPGVPAGGAPTGGPPPSSVGAPVHPSEAQAHEDWQLQPKIAKRQKDIG